MMTKTERKAINKANAAASTGPKTIEGKQKVRSNALVHGYCAKNIDVLIPDADERDARMQRWHDAFDPQTLAEEKHVEEAAIAEYKLHAATTAIDRVIGHQLETFDDRWEIDRLNRRDDLIDLLTVEPARALRELGTFAAGAEWVRDAWLELKRCFDEHGRWTIQNLVDRALRLAGYDPDDLADAPSTDGYALMDLAYSCWDFDDWRDEVDNHGLERRGRERMPLTWAGVVPIVRKTPQNQAKAELAARIDTEIARWEAKLARALVVERSEKSCAEAVAHVPHDTPGNKSLLRYATMASSALNRAMNGLQKAEKERDREAEKEDRANKANEARRPPLEAEEGKSYVRIEGDPYRVDPIGEGRFQLTSVSRISPGVICRHGVACDPVETGPETGS